MTLHDPFSKSLLSESPAYLKWKEETINEGILLGKLASVPILAQQGLSAEEIAQRLDLPPVLVAQALDP